MGEPIYGQEAFTALSRELLEAGHSVRFRAHGTSMRPFIRDGDVIVVEPAPRADLRRGDVVLYTHGRDSLVLHRLVEAAHRDGHALFTARGDASALAAEPVDTERILGRAVSLERAGAIRPLRRGRWRWAALTWMALRPLRRAWARTRSALLRSVPSSDI